MSRVSFIWASAFAVLLGACDETFECGALYVGQPSAAAPPRDLTVADPLAARPIPLRLFAPEGDRAAPLVAFSTGLGAEPGDFDHLGEALSRHGYAVAVITHPESTAPQACGRVSGAACWERLSALEAVPELWDRRFADVGGVLAAAAAGALPVPVDLQRVAVGGHSFGAFTALALAGTTYVDPRSGARVARGDPRVRAVFAMSPQGPDDVFGLDARSWGEVRRPVLLLTGDRDGSDLPHDSAAWRREPFLKLPPGDKFLLRLADGDHRAFMNDGRRPHLGRTLTTVALAFLDAYLRGNGVARQALASEPLRVCSRARASIEER